jgi:chlorite dismutase
MIEQINNIQDKNDFIIFVRKLALDFNEHKEEWENISIPDFLEQMTSWIEDYSESPYNDIEWDKPDFQMFAKILYMGKIYE